MIKKLKKILTIILSVLLLLGVLPSSGLAFSEVDLSRVKFSSGSEIVAFRFGGLEVFGKLYRVAPFEEGQVEQIIIDTMEQTGISEAELHDANQKIEKAKRYGEITQADIDHIVDNLATSAGVVPGAGTAVLILQMVYGYMNSSSWDDVGTTSANAFESSASEWVKETATGFIKNNGGEIGEKMLTAEKWRGQLTAIASFCKMLSKEYARDKQKWKDIADAANVKLLVNEFYQKLQANIDKAMRESEQLGWEIDFNSKGGTGDGSFTEREFSFFGVDGNKQTWYLDMNMKQTATDEFGSVVGLYEGTFIMRAAHNMSSFIDNIDQAARNMDQISDFLKLYEDNPMYKAVLSPACKGSVYIERVISGTCNAEIDKSGKITLTLDEQSDNTKVIFSDIMLDLKIEVVSKGYGTMMGMTFPIEIGNDEQSIILKSSMLDISDYLPDYNVDVSIAGSGEGNIGWDDEIWRHWDGTYAEKELIYAGK